MNNGTNCCQNEDPDEDTHPKGWISWNQKA
jgi:hypothetical protein